MYKTNMDIAGNAIIPILESTAINSLPLGPKWDPHFKTPIPNLTPLTITTTPRINMNIQCLYIRNLKTANSLNKFPIKFYFKTQLNNSCHKDILLSSKIDFIFLLSDTII